MLNFNLPEKELTILKKFVKICNLTLLILWIDIFFETAFYPTNT